MISKPKLPRFEAAPMLLALMMGLAGLPALAGAADDKAEEVVQAAIEALGGQSYLQVKNTVSEGRFFFYRDGRKGFARFFDWTVFEQPVRSRFQFGKGNRAEITIHHLGVNKGWVKESPYDVKELGEEEMEDFRRSINKNLDYLLRNRLTEDGLSMFYYGPNDIAGSGELEAVEFIDRTNDSVIVYFNRETHLPIKVESHFTSELGIRHKREIEFYNWHDIEGVLSPLRTDTLVDGELSEQSFLEVMLVNQLIPAEFFQAPEVKERKKKKKKN